jgi:hypothetical protein
MPQFISFTSKIHLILKQVLMLMPVYHLMYMKLPVATRTHINWLCKDFLWGYSKEGKQKTPLVAWSKLCRVKKHGGLAIKDIHVQNTAL